MRFSEFKYERPNYEAIKEEMELLINAFENAKSAKEQIDIIHKVNKIFELTDTMLALSYIRHSLNTKDEFYDNENDYWDEQDPLYEELYNRYYKVLAKSPFRNEIEQELGKQFYIYVDSEVKTMSPEIVEDLQEENKLTSQYDEIIAEALIDFKGEKLTLPALDKYREDKDRTVREAAANARYKFFAEHEETFDQIYDKLIKVRTKMAKKLGLDSFTELGYLRMGRAYTPQAVEKFRKQVLEHIVPVASSLYDAQRKRLGYEELRYFDLGFKYLSGNATPKGDPEWILEQGVKMYHEMSPETADFFDYMVNTELFDVIGRPNKLDAGYCYTIENYQAPFIFANFNGTKGDIDVLTHEVGHAFQGRESRHIELMELRDTTQDSSEIHSMSMEFFAWPWMESFFKEDTKKYKHSHLSGAVEFIPYGIVVDEYQHIIYGNPDLTPAERKVAWRELEKQYLPHKNYTGCDYLERGNFWHQQSHIFTDPFYYIDYVLAQICALQLWKRMHDNREDAWNDYLRLCQAGGKMTFPELVEYGNLKSPFEDGCVSSIITEIKTWLDNNKDLE